MTDVSTGVPEDTGFAEAPPTQTPTPAEKELGMEELLALYLASLYAGPWKNGPPKDT